MLKVYIDDYGFFVDDGDADSYFTPSFSEATGFATEKEALDAVLNAEFYNEQLILFNTKTGTFKIEN